jgi:hypothetical protein
MSEPYRLFEWRLPSPNQTSFYTCARPGRSIGKNQLVSNDLVFKWAKGLPNKNTITIISLLGTKTSGKSEFSFYWAFHDANSMAQWLNGQVHDRHFQIISYPTVDGTTMNQDIVDAAAQAVLEHTSNKTTVILMDSGGMQRTGAVAAHLGAVKLSDNTQIQDSP